MKFETEQELKVTLGHDFGLSCGFFDRVELVKSI